MTSSATPGQITYNLSVPSISRPGRIAYLTLTYSNAGGSDALAPLFVVSVTSGNATIGLPGETSFLGIERPGARHRKHRAGRHAAAGLSRHDPDPL